MISIVLLTRNRSGLLNRCIESILSQTYTDFELIILDHNSTDDTAKVVGNYADPRIRYYKEAEDNNIPKLRNKGTLLAKGDRICVMDDDDVMMPTRLEMEAAVDADVVYSSYEETKGDKNELKKATPFSKEELYHGSLFIHGTLLIRKEWLEKYPYDEKLTWNSDWSMALCLAYHGATFGHVDAPLLRRYWHQDNLTMQNPEARTEMVKKIRSDFAALAGDEFAMTRAELPFARKKVSVIIPYFNKFSSLIELQAALRFQSHKNIEVIIADDGSHERCDGLFDGMDVKYYWQRHTGYRLNSIRNAGKKLATGDIVVYLDADIIPIGDDFIRRIVKWHVQNPNKIATFQRLRRFADRIVPDNKQPLSRPWHNFSGGMFSIEKRTLDRVGDFDENYNFEYGWDDVDFAYRAIQMGVPVIVEKSFEVYHIEHEPVNKKITGRNARYFNQKFRLEIPKAGETATKQLPSIPITK